MMLYRACGGSKSHIDAGGGRRFPEIELSNWHKAPPYRLQAVVLEVLQKLRIYLFMAPECRSSPCQAQDPSWRIPGSYCGGKICAAFTRSLSQSSSYFGRLAN